jgi:hypothetical protein
LADAAGENSGGLRVHRILIGVGIFLGFLANLLTVVFVSDKLKAWRVLTNTVLIPTIPLLVMIYLMPESPRYLMKVRTNRATAATELIFVSMENIGKPWKPLSRSKQRRY